MRTIDYNTNILQWEGKWEKSAQAPLQFSFLFLLCLKTREFHSWNLNQVWVPLKHRFIEKKTGGNYACSTLYYFCFECPSNYSLRILTNFEDYWQQKTHTTYFFYLTNTTLSLVFCNLIVRTYFLWRKLWILCSDNASWARPEKISRMANMESKIWFLTFETSISVFQVLFLSWLQMDVHVFVW